MAIGSNAVLVIGLRKKYPCWTLQKIATKVNLSRERVRQILVREKLSTRAQKQSLHCRYCGAEITYKNAYAARIKKNFVDLCSKCHRKYELLTMLECEECKVHFLRRTSLVVYMFGVRNYQHVWCSKHCQGVWVGKNHGFNASKGFAIRQYTPEQYHSKYLDFINLYNALKKAKAAKRNAILAAFSDVSVSAISQRLTLFRKLKLIS